MSSEKGHKRPGPEPERLKIEGDPKEALDMLLHGAGTETRAQRALKDRLAWAFDILRAEIPGAELLERYPLGDEPREMSVWVRGLRESVGYMTLNTTDTPESRSEEVRQWARRCADALPAEP